ncbi:MAG: biotin transporter BioY [Oscillospiraceae bacterium]|nr:biotin transporter BioY [Oscillospiraceae bacterium]MBO5918112.1 biotin transporter BioY [Oscillospiraceae bacterium]
MRVNRSGRVYALTMTAAAAAALCVLGPWAVPVGAVPLSLTTLAVYLTAFLLTPGQMIGAVAVFLLLGAAGLPVFSGFTAGPGVLAGPTGGYLLGCVPAGALCAGAARRDGLLRAAGMVLATGVVYLTGTAWYCLQSGVAVLPALAVCVLPFLPGDALKLAAALMLGPAVRKRLERTGLLR